MPHDELRQLQKQAARQAQQLAKTVAAIERLKAEGQTPEERRRRFRIVGAGAAAAGLAAAWGWLRQHPRAALVIGMSALVLSGLPGAPSNGPDDEHDGRPPPRELVMPPLPAPELPTPPPADPTSPAPTPPTGALPRPTPVEPGPPEPETTAPAPTTTPTPEPAPPPTPTPGPPESSPSPEPMEPPPDEDCLRLELLGIELRLCLGA